MANTTANRSVSFNPLVRCVRTIHIDDYTDEEISNTWINKDEFNEMKRHAKVTIAMMNKKVDFVEGLNYSARGLETRTATAAAQKAQNQFCAMAAVLDEQDRQFEAGIYDPAAFSLAYAEYSFISRMSAFLMAAADAKNALGHDITSSTSSCKPSSIQTKESLSALPQPFPKIFRIEPSQRVSMAA